MQNKTAESALDVHNQENALLSLDPLPHERVGSGDKAIAKANIFTYWYMVYENTFTTNISVNYYN